MGKKTLDCPQSFQPSIAGVSPACQLSANQTWTIPTGHCRGGLACVPHSGNNWWLITRTQGEERRCLWSQLMKSCSLCSQLLDKCGGRFFKSQGNGSCLLHITCNHYSLLGGKSLLPLLGPLPREGGNRQSGLQHFCTRLRMCAHLSSSDLHP